MQRSSRVMPLVTVALVVSAAALVSCMSNPTDASLAPLGPTDNNITGSFDLTLVNGQPLPEIAPVSSTEEVQVQNERLVIAADSTWADTSTTVMISLLDGTSGSPTVGATAGILTISNGTIKFATTAGGTAAFNGSVHGDSLFVDYGGTRFLYLR